VVFIVGNMFTVHSVYCVIHVYCGQCLLLDFFFTVCSVHHVKNVCCGGYLLSEKCCCMESAYCGRSVFYYVKDFFFNSVLNNA